MLNSRLKFQSCESLVCSDSYLKRWDLVTPDVLYLGHASNQMSSVIIFMFIPTMAALWLGPVSVTMTRLRSILQDVEQQGNNFARRRKKIFFRHGTVAGCQLLSNDIKFKTGIDLINSMQFLTLKHH